MNSDAMVAGSRGVFVSGSEVAELALSTNRRIRVLSREGGWREYQRAAGTDGSCTETVRLQDPSRYGVARHGARRKGDLSVFVVDSTSVATSIRSNLLLIDTLGSACEVGCAKTERCSPVLGRKVTPHYLRTLQHTVQPNLNITWHMPKISFGPNRRIGALGAYVVTIDPEKKLFPATMEWVGVD